MYFTFQYSNFQKGRVGPKFEKNRPSGHPGGQIHEYRPHAGWVYTLIVVNKLYALQKVLNDLNVYDSLY